VVLLVLDYTALTTSAAGELKERVRAAIDVIGSSNLIVVVNRIDQRRTPADLTPEQVESFVTSHLGQRHVRGLLFETSALYAFVGARYLRERKLRPHATVRELRTEVEAVLKEAEPTKWQRRIERYTLEDADEDAELLWEQSGFDALLKSAMSGLLDHIGPLCISTAISHARAIVRTVNEAARLRESALQSKMADLDREVRKLEKQESELEEKARGLEDEMKSVKKNCGTTWRTTSTTRFAKTWSSLLTTCAGRYGKGAAGFRCRSRSSSAPAERRTCCCSGRTGARGTSSARLTIMPGWPCSTCSRVVPRRC